MSEEFACPKMVVLQNLNFVTSHHRIRQTEQYILTSISWTVHVRRYYNCYTPSYVTVHINTTSMYSTYVCTRVRNSCILPWRAIYTVAVMKCSLIDQGGDRGAARGLSIST